MEVNNAFAHIVVATLGGFVLSCAAEKLVRPKIYSIFSRSATVMLVHFCLWMIAFGIEMAIFRRPYFSAANVLLVQIIVIAVNNEKYFTLREPFVYADFEYFADALKHPRLYIPYFGAIKLCLMAGISVLFIYLGISIESSLLTSLAIGQPEDMILGNIVAIDSGKIISFYLIIIISILVLYWILISNDQSAARIDPIFDIKTDGLISTLWRYYRIERRSPFISSQASPFSQEPQVRRDELQLPHLVSIQSESFVDLRRSYPSAIKDELLVNFDRIKLAGVSYGELEVPSWGANTVRAEFSFLTGTNTAQLEIHQFNPYKSLGKQKFPSIANYLRKLGYRTICVHPYHRSFYNRDVVIPNLGFDEFYTIEAFCEGDFCGPYIGDAAVGKFVLNLLLERDIPTFVHVITMENHGPLHLEAIDHSLIESVFHNHMPLDCNDLLTYGKHLKNADLMLDVLVKSSSLYPRPLHVCFYGDHVPIMKKVYEQLGPIGSNTDYIIWGSHTGSSGSVRQQMNISKLATEFLHSARLY